jgi:hypothetical protein
MIRLKNRIKRCGDILEKLGVGCLIVGLFNKQDAGLWLGFLFLAISLCLTKEE